MSKISTTGFYIIDSSFEEDIFIEENLYVSLFIKNISHDISIYIGENSKVDIYGFFSESCPKNIRIMQNCPRSKLHLKALFISDSNTLVSNISSHIKGENIISQVHIISIIKESHIGVESSIHIEKQSKKIQANLDLENIFIGNAGTLHSLPNLFIDANDVQVSHSSKTHRIEENKLFYLKSRGLNTPESIQLMTESYFKKMFGCMEMIDSPLYETLHKDFLDIN